MISSAGLLWSTIVGSIKFPHTGLNKFTIYTVTCLPLPLLFLAADRSIFKGERGFFTPVTPGQGVPLNERGNTLWVDAATGCQREIGTVAGCNQGSLVAGRGSGSNRT